MHSIVLSSLLPVVILIAIGFIACCAGWMRAEATKDLGRLVFMVLTPALLFRTMSTVHVERLDFKPVVAYFVAVIGLFLVMLVWRRASQRATVLALAATFSNTVAIGVPLVGLAYGEQGMVTLFTIISLHALILLTMATIALELAVARQAAVNTMEPGTRAAWRKPVLDALRSGILHPVPLPILVGLLFAQTGLVMGLQGLPLTVMVVTASLPIGANVFMFSQRYQVAEELVTAGVAVSTALAMVTVSLVMALAERL